MALVAWVVLFVDDDQFELRDRRQHRHAGAQHNARRAAVGCQPGIQALRWRHATVHGNHRLVTIQLTKTRLKTRFQLGCQVDLGHHHQHLRVGGARQQLGSAVHEDFGFATAGGTKQQKRPWILMKLTYSPFLLFA